MRGRASLVAAGSALLATVLAGAAGAVGGGAPAGTPVTERAFSADAAAFPVEPGFGAQQFAIPVRPVGTRSSVANAPISAYGRASAVDLGPAELYTAPNFPPPGSFAECDTARSNSGVPSATPSGMRLQVSCDRSPASRASADGPGVSQPGFTARSASSRTSAEGAGDTLTATADGAVSDADLASVHVGSAHFHADVRANGRPGGAAAAGRVSVTDATVNGVPVVFGPDGVQVDTTKVPLDLVATAADAVHKALSYDGYSNVRLVQPQASAALDGSKASVSGGGLEFLGSSNDPQNNYFLSMRLVGGEASVALGASLQIPSTAEVGAVAGPPSSLPPSLALPSVGSSSLATVTAGQAAVPPSPPAAAPRLVGTTARYRLPGTGRGWLWAVLAAVGVAVAAAATRRPLVRTWAQLADRYVRG